MAEAYGVWRALLAGKPVEVSDGVPHAGYYKRRIGKGQGYVPVAIWPDDETGELIGLVGTKSDSVELTPQGVRDVWTWVVQNRVLYEDYQVAYTTGKWPGEVEDPTEGRELTIAEKVAETVQAAAKWLLSIDLTISTEQQAHQAGEWKDKLTKLEKAAEARRRELKQPHEDAAKAVDAQWFPIVRSASSTKVDVSRVLEDYGRRLKAEADRKAREETERLRQEAEFERQRQIEEARAERERLAEQHPGLLFNSPPPEEDIPPPVVEEVKAAPLQAVGGLSGGRRTGFRTVNRAGIEDWEAVTLHYVRMENAKIREVIQKLADADAKAGNKIPGVQIISDIKAA